jgi:Cft2 family RNA processing exonuclease
VLLLTYTPLQSDRATPYTVLYTGDFFLSNSRLVEGLPLAELRGLRPNVLILEGSYGTARFTHRRQQENLLAERISQAIIQGQSVLLPVPFLGLGQELLMILRSHHLFTGRDFDIWVESPLAAGCDAYLQILPHLPANVQNFARHQPLFWDERVRPRVSRLPVNDRLPVDRPFPCIVLADQEGDWHRFYQGDPQSWLVLLPQSPGRLAITDSDTGSTPVLGDRPVAIETYFLAEHCDGSGTTQLIHNIRPQHVVFVHGSPPYLADLTGLDELYNRYHLHSPAAHTLVELPVGETFYQPPAPDTSYEGELTETESSVTLTLPHTVTLDPRWQQFADTGLVVARWQGEELVLRGLSQRELLH